MHAERFLPERWLRHSASLKGYYQHHPYSFIPFGVGVRACVGKRVAELEMYFALTRVRNRKMSFYSLKSDTERCTSDYWCFHLEPDSLFHTHR